MNAQELKRHIREIDAEVQFHIENADEIIENNDWRHSQSELTSILKSTTPTLRSYMLMAIDDCDISPACLFYDDPYNTMLSAENWDDENIQALRLTREIDSIKVKVEDDTEQQPADEAIDSALSIIVLDDFVKRSKKTIRSAYRSMISDSPKQATIIERATEYVEELPTNLIINTNGDHKVE